MMHIFNVGNRDVPKYSISKRKLEHILLEELLLYPLDSLHAHKYLCLSNSMPKSMRKVYGENSYKIVHISTLDGLLKHIASSQRS